MSADLPIASIIEPPQIFLGTEQRAFKPAQFGDGKGNFQSDDPGRIAWGKPIEERLR
jgi:hypothetical protein